MSAPQTPFDPETLSSATSLLRIDPDAVVRNWHSLGSRLTGSTRASAVVKADAYGLGASKIVPGLLEAGCRDFFVALLDEALALRSLIPKEARLFVLSGPVAGTEDLYLQNALIPVLNSRTQIEQWQNRGPCAWHVDTGMTRLGIEPSELQSLVNANTHPVLLMSHLACADEPCMPLNRTQADTFRTLRSILPEVEASLAASSGIFLGEDWHFDLVRPGIALYGGTPLPGQPNPQEPVVRLQGKILQIREIDTPKPVGYGSTASVEAGCRLATVAYGYADGYPRAACNRAAGVLGEYKVPVVGRVSMDLLVMDVSSVPRAIAVPGAMVDLIGQGYTLDDLADDAQTISYEILTSLKPRGPRLYGPLLSEVRS